MSREREERERQRERMLLSSGSVLQRVPRPGRGRGRCPEPGTLARCPVTGSVLAGSSQSQERNSDILMWAESWTGGFFQIYYFLKDLLYFRLKGRIKEKDLLPVGSFPKWLQWVELNRSEARSWSFLWISPGSPGAQGLEPPPTTWSRMGRGAIVFS